MPVVAGIVSSGPAGGPPGPSDEFVVLVHPGVEPVTMAGWSLTNRKRDGVDHYRYIFPRFLSNGDLWQVNSGGVVLVYTGRGTNGRTASRGEAHQHQFFQHRAAWIWAEAGDTVCLYDRAGRLVSACAVPAGYPTA